MLQLNVLSGARTGQAWVAEDFPVLVGRAANAGVRLEEAGIWDKHAEIRFHETEGFILIGHHGAITSVNGTPIEEVRLRNGDIIEMGSVKLQCWLAEVKRRSLTWREQSVWIGLALLTIAQLILIACLL